MKWLRRKWRQHIWLRRLSRGKCVDCGKHPPLPDEVICGLCVIKFINRGGK